MPRHFQISLGAFSFLIFISQRMMLWWLFPLAFCDPATTDYPESTTYYIAGPFEGVYGSWTAPDGLLIYLENVNDDYSFTTGVAVAGAYFNVDGVITTVIPATEVLLVVNNDDSVTLTLEYSSEQNETGRGHDFDRRVNGELRETYL